MKCLPRGSPEVVPATTHCPHRSPALPILATMPSQVARACPVRLHGICSRRPAREFRRAAVRSPAPAFLLARPAGGCHQSSAPRARRAPLESPARLIFRWHCGWNRKPRPDCRACADDLFRKGVVTAKADAGFGVHDELRWFCGPLGLLELGSLHAQARAETYAEWYPGSFAARVPRALLHGYALWP